MSLTRELAIGGYLAAALAAVALELLARRNGSRLPTLGRLCEALLRLRAGPRSQAGLRLSAGLRFRAGLRLWAGGVPVGRIAGYAVWCWLGWHLFAR